VLACLAWLLAARTASAQVCFESPTGTAWALPRDCAATGCAVPTVDGAVIGYAEYADAYRAKVQDFVKGHTSGEVAFELDGSTLYIALTVSGDPGCGEEFPTTVHTLDVFLDGRRNGTTCNSRPEPQDRRITLKFDPLTTSVSQFMGNGNGWVTAPFGFKWPVQHYTSYSTSDRRYVIELAIGLKPAFARGASGILREGKFGLAVNFDLPCENGNYTFPNRGPAYRLDTQRPVTWETVTVKYPPSVRESVLSYNVGQMPWGLSDGGSGDPEHFGYLAALADHACLSEAWPHDTREDIYSWAGLYAALAGHDMHAIGRPHDLDTLEEEFPEPKGTPIVQVLETPPTYVIVGDSVIAGLTGLDDEDTGLLVLSRRPFLDGKVVEYDYDDCLAEDCYEDKGFIWGRALTTAAEPPAPGPGEISAPQGYNGDEFLDLFCTHLQANPELPILSGETPEGVRAKQLSALVTFANAVRATDRPALVMGDLNVNGKKWPNAEYASVLATLGIDQLTPFDENNSFLSKRYDLGVHLPYTTVEADLAAAQQTHGDIAEGTRVDQLDCELQFTNFYSRLDYVFALPAPGLLPAYGAGAHTVNDEPLARPQAFLPGAKLDPNDPGSPKVPGSAECLSDHAALFGKVRLVRLAQPGTWNPASWHKLIYRVVHVEDLTGDCWGCGDTDFWGEVEYGIHPNSTGAIFHKKTGVFDDDPEPNLGLQALLFSGPIYPPGKPADLNTYFWTRFKLMEEDFSSPDDHFDTSDNSFDEDPEFRFFRATGQWVRMRGSLPPEPLGALTFKSSLVKRTEGYHGKERARVHAHELRAVETLPPVGGTP
jgi:hypothetical protein